ncbi:hypothetical protein C8Q76DRAFT_793028 [Earliella scabrosa]|nr:hypothetical protein C8Q76DRAFT_793028 [Earliella scabrosa]
MSGLRAFANIGKPGTTDLRHPASRRSRPSEHLRRAHTSEGPGARPRFLPQNFSESLEHSTLAVHASPSPCARSEFPCFPRIVFVHAFVAFFSLSHLACGLSAEPSPPSSVVITFSCIPCPAFFSSVAPFPRRFSLRIASSLSALRIPRRRPVPTAHRLPAYSHLGAA